MEPVRPRTSRRPASCRRRPSRSTSATSAARSRCVASCCRRRNAFSSPAEFERLSGPLKWNRQQGLYIYRADRLVQWGGWAGIRGIDEHTKLARAALDFDTDLDAAFNINVAKMRVAIPPQLRSMLSGPSTSCACGPTTPTGELPATRRPTGRAERRQARGRRRADGAGPARGGAGSRVTTTR